LAIRPALTVAASSQQYNLAQQSHSAIFAAKSHFSGKSTDWPDRANEWESMTFVLWKECGQDLA
jgi:hypothetical protein